MSAQQPTINDLEKSNTGPVWVLNTSKGSNRSIIVLSVPKAQGGTDNVRVPVTFLPINLTDQVPKRQLLQSSDFRRAVSSRWLSLVSEEEAQKVMGRPGAQEEIDRLMMEERTINNDSARMVAGVENPEAVASTGISPRVQQFISTLEESSEPKAALNTLRSMGELTEQEFRAVSRVAADRKYQDIVAHCEEQIESMSA